MKKLRQVNRDEIAFELLYAEPFIEKDFEAVRDLLVQLSPQSVLTPESYAAAVGGQMVIVARLPDGCIVGTASLVEQCQLSRVKHSVEDVVVHSGYQGCGIGRGLMDKLIWFAREYGIRILDLNSSSRRQAARGLYESLGFKRRDSDLFRLEIK